MRLEEVVEYEGRGKPFDERRAIVYLSNILGRTIDETRIAVEKFEQSASSNSLYHIVYHLGRVAINEERDRRDRGISFSANLREIVGQHTFGAKWADQIKNLLFEKGLIDCKKHVISANLHSVKNTLYAFMP